MHIKVHSWFKNEDGGETEVTMVYDDLEEFIDDFLLPTRDDIEDYILDEKEYFEGYDQGYVDGYEDGRLGAPPIIVTFGGDDSDEIHYEED